MLNNAGHAAHHQFALVVGGNDHRERGQ
jgi:hypothetical protein